MGKEIYWALNFSLGVENFYWKFGGRKMNSIQVIEDRWSWLFWWGSSAVYSKLNNALLDLVAPAIAETTQGSRSDPQVGQR